VAEHATVDEYIAAIPEPLRKVAVKAREVVDAELEGASSAIRGRIRPGASARRRSAT
jgi:hypothetical protein